MQDRPVFVPPPPRDGDHVELFPGTTQVRIAGSYRKGLRHGVWKLFHANGQLAEEYHWEDGVQHGPELDWTDAGIQVCEGRNERGLRAGTWRWWHRTGAPKLTLVYDAKGRRQGPFEQHGPDGDVVGTGAFLDDQYDGACAWVGAEGFARLERSYARGRKHGKDMAWHAGGVLAYKRSWIRGEKHGEEEVFDATGAPTFKGTWQHGLPVGEHLTWTDGVLTRQVFEHGIPQELAANTKLRDKIVKKLKKAKDSYAKDNALEEAGYDYRAAYLVHLWRAKQVDVGADPELWERFAQAHPLLDGADVMALLAKAKTKGVPGDVLPGWSLDLDRLVLTIYARDPGPIDAGWRELPTPVRAGVALVRARFGKDVGDVLHDELANLAHQHVERYGLDRILWPDAEGVLVEQPLRADFTGAKTPQFAQLLALFGTHDEWVAELRTLMHARLDDDYETVRFALFREAIIAAPVGELARILSRVDLHNNWSQDLQRAIGEWRSDAPGALAEVALAMRDSLRWPVVASAMLAHAKAGMPIPDALVDALELAADPITYSSSWWSDPLRTHHDRQHEPYWCLSLIPTERGVARPRGQGVRAALAAASDAQARRAIERHLERGNAAGAAAYLARIDDPALWERVAAQVTPDDNTAMYGLGELGARALPMLVERGFPKAVTVALARASVDDGDYPAAYDTHIAFDLADYDAYAPFVWRILATIPQPRVEAVLVRGLAADGADAFARAFSLIALCPTQPVIDAAFAALRTREAKLNRSQQELVAKGIAGLPAARAYVRWMLATKLGGGLGDTLKRAIGWGVYEEIEKELASQGAAAPVAIDAVEKLRLLAADVGGSGERVYALRTFAEDAAPAHVTQTLNVLGGPAPGVDAKRWPTFGDDEEPMTHLFTLDVATMPELAEQVGDDVRCISVFCWSPDNNEAWEPGNDYTAVVLTTKKQLAAKKIAPPDEVDLRPRTHFEPVAIDVAPSVWSEDSELRRQLYGCAGRVLGEPLWLQGDQGGDGFLMQFDEAFCDVNLGDSGVMYVSVDDAFWQCH